MFSLPRGENEEGKDRRKRVRALVVLFESIRLFDVFAFRPDWCRVVKCKRGFFVRVTTQ